MSSDLMLRCLINTTALENSNLLVFGNAVGLFDQTNYIKIIINIKILNRLSLFCNG